MSVQSLPTLIEADIANGIWVSSYEAERLTGYSRETLKRLVYQGGLEAGRYPKKKGGTNYRWYFRRDQLAAKEEKGDRSKAKSKPVESYEIMQGRILQLEGRLMKLKAVRDTLYPVASRYDDRPSVAIAKIEAVPKSLKSDELEHWLVPFDFVAEGIADRAKQEDELYLVEKVESKGVVRFLVKAVWLIGGRYDDFNKQLMVDVTANKKSFENPRSMTVESYPAKGTELKYLAMRNPQI
jgi:hypothetical protein